MYQPLGLTVAGLDDIVQILDLAVRRFLCQLAFLLQLGNRDSLAARLVGVDDARHLPVLAPLEVAHPVPCRRCSAEPRLQNFHELRVFATEPSAQDAYRAFTLCFVR